MDSSSSSSKVTIAMPWLEILGFLEAISTSMPVISIIGILRDISSLKGVGIPVMGSINVCASDSLFFPCPLLVFSSSYSV